MSGQCNLFGTDKMRNYRFFFEIIKIEIAMMAIKAMHDFYKEIGVPMTFVR